MPPEDNTSILMRIRVSHPQAEVTRGEGGVWQALIKDGTGERAVYRRKLADLECRLDALAAAGAIA